MNFRILSVKIENRKQNVMIPLSSDITFFYGNSGTGKTTLLNLIMYVLGQDIKISSVLQKEVQKVILDVYINDKHVILERDIGSKYITIHDFDTITVLAKNDQSNRHSFSDYLFSQIGQAPFEMVRGKSSKSVRITYANFLWFSFLQQSDLDNTLFYLGEKTDNFKSYASQFVLRSIMNEKLGYESLLTKEINTTKENQRNELLVITIIDEILATSNIFKIDFLTEIKQKSKKLNELERLLDDISSVENTASVVKIAKQAGKYEGEIRYLKELDKIASVRSIHQNNLNHLYDKEQLLKTQLVQQQDGVLEQNLHLLEELFRDTLIGIRFPYLSEKDVLTIDKDSFIPKIYRVETKTTETYSTLSGGSRSIFKICYAISIYRLVRETGRSLLLPSFLIIDTAMKNISERIDKRLYDSFYKYIYKMFSKGGKLDGIQLIIVDKEMPPIFLENNVASRMFTGENPLIPM